MKRALQQRRLGPQKSDSGAVAESQIWIITPEESRESNEQAALRREAFYLAQERGIVILTRRTKRHIIEGGPDAQKRFELLEPRDAGDLYRAMHRRHILVFALGACFVRSDPSESPTRQRHARRLEDYVRYKATYGLARGPSDPATILATFISRQVAGGCSDSRDPRVLPLHVFDNSRVWKDLDDDAGASKFASTYGGNVRRIDANGRTWTASPVGHGQDSLIVSGFALPQGFHWDVQRGKATERLTTCHEVWKLKASGYANVYPDAYVRVGKNCGRRVWPAH